MSQPTKSCKNCAKTFDISYEFCPYCGQKKEDKLTLGVLFYNTISNYFSFDARFFKSFVPLMTKPGFLPEKFVAGKRSTYIHPAQLYLFVTIVFFFLFSISISGWDDSIEPVVNMNSGASGKIIDSLASEDEDLSKAISDMDIRTAGMKSDGAIVDSLIQAEAPKPEIYKAMGMDEDAGYFQRKAYGQLLKLREDKVQGSKAISQAFMDNIPIAMFFLLPVFALLLKLFFGKGRPYVWHLVFSLYLFSFVFALSAILLLIEFVVKWPAWIDGLIALGVFLYLVFAVKRFYQQSRFLSVLKSGSVSFLFTLIVLPVTIALLGVTAFFFS